MAVNLIPGVLKNRLAVNLPLILLISLVMCNKDEYGPDTDFRVFQVKTYNNDLLSEVEGIRYSGEIVVMMEREIPPIFGGPAMYNKTEVNYPLDDSVVIRNY